MKRTRIRWVLLAAAMILAMAGEARAGIMMTWNDGQGLSASGQVEMLGARQMRITVINTSTALPPDLAGDTSNQLLTSISVDLGDARIIGKQAVLGADGYTVNFDNVGGVQLGPGADVSGEWGFGNDGEKIDLAPNFISAMKNHTTAFGGANLDGPSNLSGPQGGLVATPALMDLGGLGGIAGTVVFTINLDRDYDLAAFLPTHSVVEFGSDAAYAHYTPPTTPVPEPATVALLAIGGAAMAGGAWRRRHALHRRRR